MTALFGPSARDAVLSADGRYRYWLGRHWNADLPTLGFVMLNPSTGDAEQDDPTLRRCIGFAKAYGYGSIEVVNLYAARTHDPKQLANIGDPVGVGNSSHIAVLMANPNIPQIVAAWGAGLRSLPIWRDAVGQTLRLACAVERRLECLGTTSDGSPRHPLYLRRTATIDPWEVPEWLQTTLTSPRQQTM